MIEKLLAGALLWTVSAAAQSGVLTYHNDNAHTGIYPAETLLTPQSVQAGLFGKRFSVPLDGAVYAQPLYLPRVHIPGSGFHNVLFAVTSHDSVYALDADHISDANFQPLWQVSFVDASQGITTISKADVGCGVIPEIGISGTPVIDADAGLIYLIAATKEGTDNYVYRLHALHVETGLEQSGSPVVIEPSGFVPLAHKQRTSLLLVNGVIYSSWSGHCDQGDYHGWVMAHDAATLSLISAFNATPGDTGGSFWNGGAGPAADADGNIYAVSANAYFAANENGSKYDNSVLKLTPQQLAVADYFSPFNKVTLDNIDLDLGSSGALILPDDAGTVAHPHLIFASGKEGRLYLLDRSALGGQQSGVDEGAVSSLLLAGSPQTFGTASYFNRSLYIAPKNSPLQMFSISEAGTLDSGAQTADSMGYLGATPSISANGSQNGIAWVASASGGGVLQAFDATNLTELYSSATENKDVLDSYLEFAVPTVADGKVFLGTNYGITAYGTTPAQAPVISAVTNAASYSPDAISPGSLITIFGTTLAPATANASNTPLPLSIDDTTVTVNGVGAPLLFVSPTQVNVQVPWEVSTGMAQVIACSGGSCSAPTFINIQSVSPGIFIGTEGNAAAVNANGTINSSDHPASPGSYVSVFFTGQGPVAAAVDDGDAPPADQAVSVTSPVTATIGGIAADVEFAGLAPLFSGLAQMNVKVPPVAAGKASLVITIGGASAAAQLVVGP